MKVIRETVHFGTNQRVKAHPACDCFMQGDVYGTLRRITYRRDGKAILHVAMDRSGRTRRFPQDLLLEIYGS